MLFKSTNVEELEEKIELLTKELQYSVEREEDKDQVIKDLKADQTREISTLKHTHSQELSTSEFRFKTFKDEEIVKAKEEKITLVNANAVLVKENEMLQKMTDINADIIDVKQLVSSLVEALPKVNITGLSVVPNRD